MLKVKFESYDAYKAAFKKIKLYNLSTLQQIFYTKLIFKKH